MAPFSRGDMASDIVGGVIMVEYRSQSCEPELMLNGEQNFLALPVISLPGDSVQLLEQMMKSWTTLDGKSRLVLKKDGTLVLCSEGARDLLQAGQDLKIEQGIVSVVQHAFRYPFDQLLMVKEGDVETLLLPSSDEGHWILRAVSCGPDLICIILHLATKHYWAKLPDLRYVFGLTPSEAGIVDDLYNGLSHQEVADKRDISIFTVRAHLKRCYAKLQISTKEQLWNRLRPYQL